MSIALSVAELREKRPVDLLTTLTELYKKQFKLKLVKSAGELKQNHQIKQVRRQIARIMTILQEKEDNQ